MPTLDDEIREARERFTRWMRWYMAAFPDEAPSQAALARKLHVSPSAVSQALRQGAKRAPRFKVLLAFRRVAGASVDALLYSEPPRLPSRRMP